MQPYIPDAFGRPTSPGVEWVWDGARWLPTGRPTPGWMFASPRLRADLATAFLTMLIGLNVLDIINSIIDLIVYNVPPNTGLEGTHLLWSAGRNALVGISWLVVAFPGSVVTVSMWVHRVYRNLAALGTRAKMSPAMAVAWFYIPIANLWKPYQVIREIWNESLDVSPRSLIATWWAFWLTGCVVGNIQLGLSLRETSQASSHTAPLLISFVSDALFIAAAVQLIRIVLAVTRAQEQKAARLFPT